MICDYVVLFFFFNQKTAYDMRISDWSSDVCSSDLLFVRIGGRRRNLGPLLDHRPAGAAAFRVSWSHPDRNRAWRNRGSPRGGRSAGRGGSVASALPGEIGRAHV